MTDVRDLLDQARARQWEYKTFAATWAGTLAGLWLFLEPLGLFGVWKERFETLGLAGYLILVLASALLALFGLLLRQAMADRRLVTHLLRNPQELAETHGDYNLFVHQEGRETGQTLNALVASLAPTPITKLLTAPDGTSQIGVAQRASMLGLLRHLGLVSVTSGGLAQPVSESAACFVRSLGESMSEGVTFLGGWDKAGTENPAAQGPRHLIRQQEERRLKYVHRSHLRAIRSAKACLAIIKGRRNGEDVYLMQQSNAWGELYYWFIGGVMEDRDGSEPEACLYREIEEELLLARKDILSVSAFCEARDLRISARIGALTEYHYHVFFVQLNAGSPDVQKMAQSEFTNVTFEGVARFERKNRWLTWSELETPSIKRDAPSLIEEIVRHDPSTLPPSIGREIAG